MPYKNKEDEKANKRKYYRLNFDRIQKYRENNKNKRLQTYKKWRNTPKGRKSVRHANKKYYETHKDKVKQMNKKYAQSARGHVIASKVKARRRRDLGFIQMFPNPFIESEKIEWHHITDIYVVALPKDLHHQYLGKNHREKTMEIVKQIYLGD